MFSLYHKVWAVLYCGRFGFYAAFFQLHYKFQEAREYNFITICGWPYLLICWIQWPLSPHPNLLGVT